MIRALFADPAYLAVKWYQWGVAIGLAITLVVTLWIFYDSQRQGLQATLWRLLSLIAALVVVPSAMLSLAPSLAAGLSSLPILLAYLGVLASLLSLVVLVLYAAGIGVGSNAVVEEEPEDEASMSRDVMAADAPPPPSRLPPAQGVAASPDSEVVASQSVDLSAPFDDRTRVLTVAPPKPQPLAWLVVMNGHRAGTEFRLDPLADIGRDGRYNSIAIEDPTMSRQHARVRLEKDAFVVYDLASANGVVVNGEKQQRWSLRNGDRVVIGQTEFGFIIVAEDSDEQA